MKLRIALLLCLALPAAAQTVNTAPYYVLMTSANGFPPYTPLSSASGLGQSINTGLPYFIPMCSATGNAPYTQCSFSGGSSTLTFPATVAGTTNSGGIAYFSSATQLSSSPAGTVNTLIKWGGAGQPPTNSGVVDDGTSVRAANENVVVGTLSGTPSGVNFIASAGDTGGGTGGLITQQSFGNGTNLKIWDSLIEPSSLHFRTANDAYSSANDWLAVSRTGFVPTLATFSEPVSATAYQTGTNCSSSASPAVCGSAAAGSVVIPTGTTSSTLTVNTTAVTANSQIFFYPDDTLGTKLGVTCNSTLATLIGGSFISARTAGTSFTITFNGTIATNGVCGSFMILN